MAIETAFTQGALNPFAAPAPKAYGANLPDPNAQVQGTLEAMLDPNSSYVKNARQRGMEVAATRGGVNSSIAAGNAERSAIEAAMPLVNASLETQANRENVAAQDWLSQQNFGRSIYGQQFTSTLGMLSAVQQYALEDPELYTPEVTSGYSNFFQQNMKDIMANYFKGTPGG